MIRDEEQVPDGPPAGSGMDRFKAVVRKVDRLDESTEGQAWVSPKIYKAEITLRITGPFPVDRVTGERLVGRIVTVLLDAGAGVQPVTPSEA